jgi:hypothetical protein
VAWNWVKGPIVAKADFGNPATTSVSLCVYDYSAGVPRLVMAATVPAGATCGGPSCWYESKVGFRFKDRDARYDGIRSIAIRAGELPKIALKSKSPTVPLPTMPLVQGPAITIQFRRADSSVQCWGADYTTSVRNLPFVFKAKNF